MRPLAHAVPAAPAEALATLMVSTLEGAILIARAERSPHALTTAVQELAPALDAAVEHPRLAAPTDGAVRFKDA